MSRRQIHGHAEALGKEDIRQIQVRQGSHTFDGMALASASPPELQQIFQGAEELRDFRQQTGTLTLANERLIVDQSMVLFENNYVHLPLKTAMHAVNPI